MILYKKTKISYLLIFLFGTLTLFQAIVIAVGLLGIKEVSYTPFIIVGVMMLIALLIFTRLTIVITKEEIKAYFGFHLFQQKMKLNSIDPEKISIKNAPLSYGIGLRLTPEGTLYNLKPGKSIHLTSKDDNKAFFVGTNDAEKIREILRENLS